MIFYTHVEHSPTKTICIKYYKKSIFKKHYKHTHTHTHDAVELGSQCNDAVESGSLCSDAVELGSQCNDAL